MTINVVDDLILEARPAAVDELKHLLSRINYSDMEPCEVVAFVTLLRPVYERVEQKFRDARPPVEPIPLKLVEGVAQSATPSERRNRKRPASV
jgi:hypothetical protein